MKKRGQETGQKTSNENKAITIKYGKKERVWHLSTNI